MASRRRQGDRIGPLVGERETPSDAAQRIYGTVRRVKLDEIRIVDSVQVRVDGLDEERVERYTEFLLAGGTFKDAIVVYQDGPDLILAAGFHRCEAYRRALERFEPSGDAQALAPLMAEIRTGGHEAAIEFAEEDNLAHGLELSPRDKRYILERRFKRGHEWASLSNRALAAKLGVSDMTIGRWRAEIEEKTGATNVARGRVGKDGKTYDVSGQQIAAAREALARLALPPLDKDQREVVRRSIITSIDYIKMAQYGSGCKYRQYLPYALAVELEADEPRVSLVNWMRGELPKWQEEQDEARRTEEQAARARLKEHLLAVLLRGPFDLTQMIGLDGLAGLTPRACWDVVHDLMREGAIRRVSDDVYELVRAAEPSETEPLSDNGYQMDEPEPEADWLDATVKRAAGVALRDNTSIEYESDEAMAARLTELLRVGSHVLCDLEDVLEQTAPVPEWVLSKLDDLSKLLHGHPGQDDDIWNPGLNSLLADLNTRSRRERE